MNKLFKALNDSTRRDILDLLKERDLTAGEIAEAFDITKPSISHHLDLLRQAGLVSKERNGQFITYSLDITALEEATSWLFNLLNSNKDS